MSLRAALASALLAAAAATSGCSDPSLGGARSFAEIDTAAAARSVAEDQARLVQVRESDSRDPRIEQAAIVGPDEPVPDAWLHDSRPIVVLAHDDGAARRLAARLLRLGASRVSVLRGGIESWLGPREEPATPPATARLEPSGSRDAKPSLREPARRMETWQQSQK